MTEKREQDTKRCAKCGACTAVCPVYQVTGRESHTPRGRLHLLSKCVSSSSISYGEIFSACLLCGACLDACPRKLDTIALLVKARQKVPLQYQPRVIEKLLIQQSLSSPLVLAGLAGLHKHLARYLPQSSGLWHKLSLLPDSFSTGSTRDFGPVPKDPSPSFMYFKGCLASHLQKDIASATSFCTGKITGKNLQPPDGQTCCGLAAYASGRVDEAKKLARKNITAFADSSLPIITSCASCFSHLRSYQDILSDDPQWREKAADFSARLVEFSQFLDQHALFFEKQGVSSNAAPLRIFYHDPCHLRFGPEKIIAAPRSLIQKITGSTVLERKHGPHCCGQGGLFHIGHPDISTEIFKGSTDNFEELNADIVVTSCSGCLLQWQKGLRGSKSRILHLAVFLAEKLSEK